MGADELKKSTSPETDGQTVPGPDEPAPFQIDGVILLGADGGNPLQVEGITLTFGHEGVGVIHGHEDHPRLLPWSLLTSYALEAWSGLIVPPWWVDPELNRTDDDSDADSEVVDADSTTRSLPHTGPGALISFRTPLATYRFLSPGGDLGQLSSQVAAFIRSHQGGIGATSPVTVFAGRSPQAGGGGPTSGTTRQKGMSWARIRPILTVVLIVCLATIAILIVLQSAGTIHLPLLGGTGPRSVGTIRTP